MEKAVPRIRKSLSDEGIREKFRRAMLRFVAQCDPEFHEDETSRFFYDQSNFRGFLRLGPANREASEIWNVCLSDPVVEGNAFNYPAAGFSEAASRHGIRTIEVNPDSTEISPHFDEHLRGPAGLKVTELVGKLLAG
ncbi:MAG: hypothetical protein WCQ16_02090 [Verrucomicrobiae bacterium]